jgi:hypothetical protein
MDARFEGSSPSSLQDLRDQNIMRLARAFGVARLEAAATPPSRSALTYGSGRSIVDHKLERHVVHKPARPGSTGTGFQHYFDR